MEKTTKVYREDGSYLNVNDHQLKFLSKGGFSLKNPKSKAKSKVKDKPKDEGNQESGDKPENEDKTENEGDQETE